MKSWLLRSFCKTHSIMTWLWCACLNLEISKNIHDRFFYTLCLTFMKCIVLRTHGCEPFDCKSCSAQWLWWYLGPIASQGSSLQCLLVMTWLLLLNIQEVLTEAPLFSSHHGVVWYPVRNNIPLKDYWVLNLQSGFVNHTNTVDKFTVSRLPFKLIIHRII